MYGVVSVARGQIGQVKVRSNQANSACCWRLAGAHVITLLVKFSDKVWALLGALILSAQMYRCTFFMLMMLSGLGFASHAQKFQGDFFHNMDVMKKKTTTRWQMGVFWVEKQPCF